MPDTLWLQRISLTLDYPVAFTRNLFSPANPLLADSLGRREPQRRHRFVAVVDSGVAAAWPHLAAAISAYAEHHAARLDLAAPPLVVTGGEACKSSDRTVRDVLALLHGAAIDRHSAILAIGGGAVLDAVGYAAAICHRGVRLIRAPTTVLAQNDSAVGVKNGINAFGAKNFLGAFAAPFAVLADFDFLDTLEPRDRRAGLAEAVKVAAIRDAAFLNWMESHGPALAAFASKATEEMIRRSAELHMRHIAEGGDPFEMGSARPLDFGHWAAHKLESLTAHALRHGEAVAIGIALDSRYATEAGLLPAAEAERLCRLLEVLGFRLWDEALDLREDSGERRILAGLREFREHLGGELTITLPTGAGQAEEVHHIDPAALERALVRLRARDAAP